MNALYKYFSETLSSGESLMLAVVLVFAVGLLGKYVWDWINRTNAFYLDTPTLLPNELELMQNSESSNEELKNKALQKLEAIEPDRREALATSYSLHKTVQQLAENRLWFIYKGFVKHTLSSLSSWFGESFTNPVINASKLANKPSPDSGASTTPNIRWQQWFTLQSYSWLLLLAVAYPFAFALMNSLTTNTLNLADVELIAFGDSKPVTGYLVLIAVSVVLGIKWGKNMGNDASFFRTWSWFTALLLINVWATKSIYGNVAVATLVAIAIAVTIAVTIAVAAAGADAFSVAGSGAAAGAFIFCVVLAGVVIFSFTFDLAGTGSGVITGAVAGAVSAASALAVAALLLIMLEDIELTGKNIVLCSLLAINSFLLLYYAGVLFAITEYGAQDEQHILMLPIFLGVLPLFNVLIDWLSLNVTRLLTYKILHEKHSLIMNIGYGLLDATLAVVFVLLVTSTVLFGLTGLNHLFAANIVDLSVLMQGLGDPARKSEHYWIHAMVLSTLVPTLFHLLLVCFSLLLSGVMFWKRAAIDTFLTNSITDHNNRKGLLLYVQFRWFLVAVSAAILGYLLYWLVGQMGGLLCNWWLYANNFAHYSDALFGAISGERLYAPTMSVCKV